MSTLGATAMQQGLQSCEVCGLLSRPAPGDDDPRCPRCDEELSFRKPGSVQRTTPPLIHVWLAPVPGGPLALDPSVRDQVVAADSLPPLAKPNGTA